VRRTRLDLVPAPGVKVELALDDGAIVAGNAREPLSELELELKSGREDVLFRLGLDFLQVAQLALLNESKAERGYHLLESSHPAARKPEPIELAADMGTHEAFRRLADGVLDHLLANQPAALRGEEQEGIHQMRVGIRRLRSLLVMFERFLEPHARERFDEELKRLGQVLGLARDWDVFVDETLPRTIRDRRDLEAIAPLRAVALERQHAGHQAAKKAIFEPAFTRFVLAFRAWTCSADAVLPQRLIDRPIGKLAPEMLDRLAAKVEKRLEESDAGDPSSLHQLRKSAKKLRYAIEYLNDLYGHDAKRYYKRCSALQKRLGELNDLATGTRFACELSRAGRLDLAHELGWLANRSAALSAQEQKGIDKVLTKFERAEAFW
jgi:inorganic triphosphatase YgiF